MRFAFIISTVLGSILLSSGRDQPQWGQAWSRNMVSPETSLPSEFDPTTGQNIKWKARIGTESHGSPIISGGRVYVGTNNGEPRNPKHKGDRGVLMCFDENTGSFLWQLVVPKRAEDPYLDRPNSGIASEATVDDGRVFIVSNRGEVLCLDPRGLANGNDGAFQQEARHHAPAGENVIETDNTDADIIWLFDMVSGAGIWTHDGAHTSILVDGNYLYLNTGTGVDNTHRKIRSSDAPSLIVLDKRDGRLIAREREGIAPNIFHATWSAPSLGTLNGQKVVFFAAGNGIVYAFEALKEAPSGTNVATLRKLWQFDPDPEGPKEQVHRFTTNRREGPSTIYGMPVFVDNQLFIAGGGDLWWGKNEAWLKCITPSLNAQSANSQEIWSYPLERHTMSTPAVTAELVFIADCGKVLHCLERKTGKTLWTHEFKSEFWASPYVADGKVLIGSRKGDFAILEAGREKRHFSTVEFGAPISATATAANGKLFVGTMTHLFCLGK